MKEKKKIMTRHVIKAWVANDDEDDCPNSHARKEEEGGQLMKMMMKHISLAYLYLNAHAITIEKIMY